MLIHWLSRLFRYEAINGGDRCPTYLHRWTLWQPTIARLKGIGIYLHQFVADDWSRDLHDHPKRFISIGLWGSYVEHVRVDEPGCWEVACDPDHVMVRVRWSVPDADGAYLYVRHYEGTAWGHVACVTEADRFNATGRQPTEWFTFRPRMATAARVWRAPWVRSFPATHTHRITVPSGRPCWTLVIVLRTSRAWGFWHGGTWIPWRQYVNSDTATAMKSCPD